MVAWCAYVVAVAVVIEVRHHEHISSQCKRACRQVLDVVGAGIVVEVILFGIFGLIVLGLLWAVTGWWGRHKGAYAPES